MATNTGTARRTTLDLDQVVAVALVEAVDEFGQLTDNPVAAVEGSLIVSFRDGSEQFIAFDRSHAPPVGRVGA